MNNRFRILLLFIVDSLLVVGSVFLGFRLVTEGLIRNIHGLTITAILSLIAYYIFSYFFNLYWRDWEYASVYEVITVVKCVSATVIVSTISGLAFFDTKVTWQFLIVCWLLLVISIGGVRLSMRVFREFFADTSVMENAKPTLIVGAGAAGTLLVRQMLMHPAMRMDPIAFVDDDPDKLRKDIYGVRILGAIKDIERIVDTMGITKVVIAMPSLPIKKLNEVYDVARKTGAECVILPNIDDVMSGNLHVQQLRNVEIEDLLGRDPVELDQTMIEKQLRGKKILVTGAGGSIGSEICRQVAKFKPKEIIILGHGENSIYQLNMELVGKYSQHFTITPVIADVQDRKRIFEVMDKYKPDVVYHAAAHKHVPLMEINPREAVKNNILGTRNVAEAASHARVKSFVMVSTDKAVNPPNIMGATKRLCEMIVQDMATRSEYTKFVAVRFGNVLGSRGSVIPLFKKQIAEGGPITVTHPDIVRYFMTIPEAAQLVIQAGSLARGGEIFVLDMGKPVKIVDLAKNLIRLSGFSEGDIEIKFTGLRPGEKMYEELLNEGEVNPKQVFPKIHIGIADNSQINRVYNFIENFESYSEQELHDELIDIANKKK
ncbi:polysaccharide biosynthesis protein [Granulicatella adiacens ATCC 49175]|uniref:Polysaccharide biosynthesis protein n=1 Tax=Granulicatella adiacens ATCC 49175 TaxID=638301 RepID=C8NG01_9LACT|nr:MULTISPECIES: nucleoside-diphosphate sugar epimerase/dehydratase [Granulicatella]EEW37487.1 polysaccharide biosynthesis protein [Granulicatella adiacens ATCC 49175]MCT2160848.1 polysaccharide biosynthesis protein [Granulicatella adiacens]UAK93314.1 polysaccharide biosynthesis protein [Granulicatella adiacens]UWP37692.1 polysaccharide biosynthesis protein [Granulicatella adiacens ATCC 49175]UXY40996.1 polysaccharide biosynthesis protein [Granulicatella adiacens]